MATISEGVLLEEEERLAILEAAAQVAAAAVGNSGTDAGKVLADCIQKAAAAYMALPRTEEEEIEDYS